MVGATRLAAGAARRVGAGLVSIAAPPETRDTYLLGDPGNLFLELPEAEFLSQILADERKNCVLIGPGGGVSDRTRDCVIRVLKVNVQWYWMLTPLQFLKMTQTHYSLTSRVRHFGLLCIDPT